jgi:hypothetical protein
VTDFLCLELVVNNNKIFDQISIYFVAKHNMPSSGNFQIVLWLFWEPQIMFRQQTEYRLKYVWLPIFAFIFL